MLGSPTGLTPKQPHKRAATRSIIYARSSKGKRRLEFCTTSSNAPINVMPHVPQVGQRWGCGRGVDTWRCPEGWGFCTTSVYLNVIWKNTHTK